MRWRDLILRVWRVDPLRCPSHLVGISIHPSSFILHPSSFPPPPVCPGIALLLADGPTARPLPPAYAPGDGAKPPENRQSSPVAALHELWQDGAGMNESEKQFSFTRAASSTSGRAKNQIPISNISIPMRKERQVIWQIALGGPAVFFASAFSEEELASRFAGPTPGTARDFLVLRTLAEVQKYGAAARRWEAEKNQHSSGDRYEALIIESLQVERAAWQRRLLEALVTFINFSTTNQPEYYAHFLAVQEYERQRYCGRDE
jgi:hypothetical protein